MGGINIQKGNNFKLQNILNIVNIICSIGAIIFGILQILGICKNTMHLMRLLLSVSMITQAIKFWKNDKSTVIMSLCTGIFVFSVSIIISIL